MVYPIPPNIETSANSAAIVNDPSLEQEVFMVFAERPKVKT